MTYTLRRTWPDGTTASVLTRSARGTANAASLIALLEARVFESLPGLQVVVTALAFGGLSLAASLATESAATADTIVTLRKQVFIDTMWPEASVIRASVELLGADRVLAGSDWPIVDNGSVPHALMKAMQQAALSEEQQRAIASGNCRRLLRLDG